MFKVEYAKGVAKDLKALPKAVRRRALDITEKVLAMNPHLGKPLAGAYKGLWKYRIGDYRIVYSIEKERMVVFVLRIRNRKDVYHGIVF